MENWGLVTYREVYLVVDENSTFASRQQVALVMAHELAHQWFGNLVTMKWWDDLWLNESFANMMEYVCVDAIEPSWNIFEDFQTGGVQPLLNVMRLMVFSLFTSKLNIQMKSIRSLTELSSMPKEAASCTCFAVG